MEQRPTNRSCGTCRACCKPWGVPEVGKNDSDWCPKSTPCNGCTIYETRPEACRKYACVWLNGKMEEEHRPDRLGVIVDSETFQLGDRQVGILHLWEMDEGALEKPYVRELADLNCNVGAIVIYHTPLDHLHFHTSTRLSNMHFSRRDVQLFAATYPR